MNPESSHEGLDNPHREEIHAALEAAHKKLLEASSVTYPEGVSIKEIHPFGDHFVEFFGSHAQVDKAGPAAAYFLGEIPWSDDELENALIGMTVLTDLIRAAQSIQQADREFEASRDAEPLQGQSESVELQKIDPPGITSDSAHPLPSAGSLDETQTDREIADSRASGEEELTAGAAANAEAKHKESAEKGTVPQTFEIPLINEKGEKAMSKTAVPNWSGLPPDQVLERMSRWFPSKIIAIATGSEKPEEMPRLQPLIEKDPRITEEMMMQRCRDIEQAFAHAGESPFNRLMRESHETLQQVKRTLFDPNGSDEEIMAMQRDFLLPQMKKLEDQLRVMGVDIQPIREEDLPSQRLGRRGK